MKRILPRHGGRRHKRVRIYDTQALMELFEHTPCVCHTAVEGHFQKRTGRAEPVENRAITRERTPRFGNTTGVARRDRCALATTGRKAKITATNIFFMVVPPNP